MSLFWAWFGFWGQRGVGFPVKSRCIVSVSFTFFFAPFLASHSLFSPVGTWRFRTRTCGQLNLFLSALCHREANPSLASWLLSDIVHFLACYSFSVVGLLEIVVVGVRVKRFFIPFRREILREILSYAVAYRHHDLGQ